MIRIDEDLLSDLGLAELPAPERSALMAHIYETLEMRVGMRLAEAMTNEQLDEFEAFVEAGDEAGALAWLEASFPDYREVVRAEFDALKEEVRASAEGILEAART